MSKHPLPRLTPTRRAFLRAAVDDGGRIRKDGVSTFSGGSRYRAGQISIGERYGDMLHQLRWIEPVPRRDGRPGHEPIHSAVSILRSGWEWRITDEGRRVLGGVVR